MLEFNLVVLSDVKKRFLDKIWMNNKSNLCFK